MTSVGQDWGAPGNVPLASLIQALNESSSRALLKRENEYDLCAMLNALQLPPGRFKLSTQQPLKRVGNRALKGSHFQNRHLGRQLERLGNAVRVGPHQAACP